jgi:hypothetical protein
VPDNMATVTVVIGLLCGVVVALLTAIGAGLLAYLDGASGAASALRAGVAFGGTMALIIASIALWSGVSS